MSITLRAKRILTGALAGALVLGLLPAGVASANTDVCDNAGSAGFPDSAGATHQPNVDCMAAYGIIEGRADGTFGGSASITRAQFATLVVKFANLGAGVDLPVVAHPFTDVSAANVHADNIARLFGASIINGKTATTFQPNASISRAEAATVLKQAHEALGVDFSGFTAVEFTDVSGTHAENIGLLAAAGVINGTSATTFAPSRNVTRAETASLLKNSADVLESLSLWTADPLPGEPSASNQTFNITGGDVTVVFDTATAANNRVTYTVTNAAVGQAHRVALFDAEDLNVGANGFVTFAASSGTPNLATQTAVEAEIIAINGDIFATGTALTDAFTPTTGSFSFTVETATGELENVVPVVYFAGADGTLGGVVVGTDHVPASDTLFGVGGSIEALPQELASGALATADRAITFVDKARNIIVIDTTGAGGRRHLRYDSADTFFIGDASVADNEVTLSEFEARLSRGDDLKQTTTVYSRTGASVFELVDKTPANVAAVSADVVADKLGQIKVSGWTAQANASHYNIYRADGAALATTRVAADESKFVLIGQVASSANPLEFVDTGLANDTAFTYWVTAVIDGVESLFVPSATNDNAFDTATTLKADALTQPTITGASVTTDANLQNVLDKDDVWTITFDKSMATDLLTAGIFVISNGSSQVSVSCDGTAAGADTALCALGDAPNDGPTNSVLTLTFDSTDASHVPTFASGTNAYPLTIVTVNAAVKSADGNVLSIANSTDLTIE